MNATDKHKKEIAIIGGGAAGFFAGINCAQQYPQHRVVIFEKSGKLLSKVRVSGGGRCNVTHACFDVNQLAAYYPRGEKQLKSCFTRFMTTDTIDWFQQRGVKLKTEQDGRMFPVTDSSQTIIDCLLNEASKAGITIRMNTGVEEINKQPDGKLALRLHDHSQELFDAVLIATGGNAKPAAYDWLENLGHQIVPPVPSLFTFNIPQNVITELMGISVPSACISIRESKQSSTGPLLITHWGLSGPAVLRLSSLAARELSALNYHFAIHVSWIPEVREDELRTQLLSIRKNKSAAATGNENSGELPRRLWHFLVTKSGIDPAVKWSEVSNAQINKLVQVLLYDEYLVRGKTTFKEEFVTCGGVSLKDVDMKTMESKKMKGLYFAGEVLDIDGLTGGFNFQAAWTTGYLAGVGMGSGG